MYCKVITIQKSIVLIDKQMHRSMEQNWKVRNISSHIWTINLQQRSEKHTVEERYYLQTAVLGKLNGHMQKNQSLSHTHCMVCVYYTQRSTQNVLKCIISDKGLIWKLYKEHIQLNNNNKKTQQLILASLNNEQKSWIDIFLKTYRWLTDTRQMFNSTSY